MDTFFKMVEINDDNYISADKWNYNTASVVVSAMQYELNIMEGDIFMTVLNYYIF